jgi:hypothetical protein
MDFPIATLWISVLQLSPFFACNKYLSATRVEYSQKNVNPETQKNKGIDA